jgi:hypothetical protein
MSVWVLSKRYIKHGVEKDIYVAMAKLKSRSVNASGFLASYSLKVFPIFFDELRFSRIQQEIIPVSNHGIPVRAGEVDVEEVNDRHYVILSHWSSIFDWNRVTSLRSFLSSVFYFILSVVGRPRSA